MLWMMAASAACRLPWPRQPNRHFRRLSASPVTVTVTVAIAVASPAHLQQVRLARLWVAGPQPLSPKSKSQFRAVQRRSGSTLLPNGSGRGWCALTLEPAPLLHPPPVPVR